MNGGVLLRLAARIGPWWYAIPSALVVLAGLATCHLVDVPDVDSFEVVASHPHPSGVRSAVVMRQRHADSGATVTCLVVHAGPAPALGPSRRLADQCSLVAPERTAIAELAWLPSGKLKVRLASPTRAIAAEPLDLQCYFAAGETDAPACYRPQVVEFAR